MILSYINSPSAEVSSQW